jgi:hypothetical protein
MNKSYGIIGSVLAGCGLLMAGPASAQCPDSGLELDGTERVISVNGKSAGAQKILVIPVVDEDYGYTSGDREFAGSPFEAQLAKIVEEYTEVAQYWTEASYGNVNFEPVIPSCFYQMAGSFPTIEEAPFRRATLTAVPLADYSPAFEYVKLDYTFGNPQQQKSVTFTSDLGDFFDNPDALVEYLRTQLEMLGADTELEVDVVDGALRFLITEEQTAVGSKIEVDMAGSDAESRRVLGLVSPTLYQDAVANEVGITSDGADLPGWAYSSDGTGTEFAMQFSGEGGAFEIAWWTWTGGCDLGINGCDEWNNASELSALLGPNTPDSVSRIEDVLGGDRPELRFIIPADDGSVFNAFKLNPDNSLGHVSKSLLREFGLASMESQEGTASPVQVEGTSLAATSSALQSFLEQEFYGTDLGCLFPGAELPNNPTSLKAAVDAYLGSFAAIHTYVLSAADVQRDNANNNWLCSDVTVGAGVETYKIKAPVALVEVSSGAEVIAHETGHNIGYPDLYDNSNTWWDDVESDYHPNLTFPGRWDLMSDHSAFSHPGAFTKQFKHAWIAEGTATTNGAIETVLPSSAPVTQQFLLTPLERPAATYDSMMTPPAGVTMAKMIVLPFGSTGSSDPTLPGHFLAIENRQEGEAFSKDLPALQETPTSPDFNKGGVRVTDNITQLRVGTATKNLSRNFSHTLTPPPYPNSGGNTVKPDETLDTTATFPSYPGVTIETVGIVPGPNESVIFNEPPSYLVNVTYATTDTLDLKIQDWRAPTQYASNAIWFSHATTVDPPTNPPIPDQMSTDVEIVGNVETPRWYNDYEGEIPLNWIHVLVENESSYDVENVRVRATFNSPGGAGDGAAWEPIVPNAYSQYLNILAGGTAVASIPWNPDQAIADAGHTCVAVEVVDWEVPGVGHIADVNPNNNLSQENVHDMVMTSNSPWTELPVYFEVHNDFDHDLPVEIEPTGLLPGYQLTLPQTRAHLAAGDSYIFEGTFRWDENQIATPPSQDPDDPYWAACDGQGGGSGSTYYYPANSMNASVGYPTEGSGWVLDEVGYLSVFHDFDGGPTAFTVRAAGAEALGEWPSMEFSVDGLPIGDVDVVGGYVGEYTFGTDVSAGVHEVRITLTNGLNDGYNWRALLVEDLFIETFGQPAHCGSIWNIQAFALLGDYRVPLGGSSYSAVAKPVATIDTTTTVDPTTGDITVTSTIDPPHPGQDVDIYVEYPSGVVDVITLQTDTGGGCSVTFTPEERGPVVVSSGLPGGGPFAPTDREEEVVEACIPAAGSGGTCFDGQQNQGEEGVDCGGPCQACPTCTAQNATELAWHGWPKTVPVNACTKVSAYPWWWGTRTMKLETAGGTSYPVPFTWYNTCSNSGGSGVFTGSWQSSFLSVTSAACATVIQLEGTQSGNVTLKYWAN